MQTSVLQLIGKDIKEIKDQGLICDSPGSPDSPVEGHVLTVFF